MKEVVIFVVKYEREGSQQVLEHILQIIVLVWIYQLM
jgi:hypothetical protein